MPNSRGIYLVSASGVPNYGDEVITRGWLRFLARHDPARDVWLDCPEPGRASVLFRDDHPRLRTCDTLWHTARIVGGREPSEDDHHRARALVRHGGTPAADLGLEVARAAGTVHILGGGFLSEHWPENFLLLSMASELKRLDPARRVYGTGLGLVPAAEAHVHAMREAFVDFDYADARDEWSASAVGIRRGTDDSALALRVGAVPVDRRSSPRLMLLLQGDLIDRGQLERSLESILRFVESEGGGGEPLGLVEGIPGVDAWYREALDSRWDGPVVLYPFAALWENGLPVRAGQWWFVTRFHFHLLAAAHGASGIVLRGASSYYAAKQESLRELGTGWPQVDLSVGDALTPPSLAPAFPARFRALGRARRRLARTLYSDSAPATQFPRQADGARPRA